MKKLLWIGLAFLIILVGCDLTSRDFYLTEGEFPEEGKGMLVLILDGSAIPTKTIAPDFDMDIFSYDIIGKIGTTTQFIDQVAATAIPSTGLYPKNGLTPAPAPNWTIEVIARNADADPLLTGTPIGQGTSASFGVSVNVMTPVTVTILPYVGNGTLNLNLSWPKTYTQNPAIVAKLTPAGGAEQNVSGDFVLDLNPNPCTAIYSTPAQTGPPPLPANSLATGYYTLTLELQGDDLDAPPDGRKTVWGDAVAIRIIDGQNSNHTWPTISIGGADITIYPDLNNPLGITIVPGTPASGSVTATATIDNATLPDPAPDTYVFVWYIDGEYKDEETLTNPTTPIANTKTLTTISSGEHNLSVVVTAKFGAVVDTVSSTTVPIVMP